MEQVSLLCKSTLVLLILFETSLLVPAIQARKITYCKKANYVVKVDDVEISPDPVEKGVPTTFLIQAYTDQPLTGGELQLAVAYFGVPVHSESHDICEKTSCPISAGNFVLSHTQILPGITPSGSYTLKLKMADEKKHELTCLSFKFQIGQGSSVSSM